MCLIIAKPRGVDVPKGEDMKRWFASHPNGFGLAFLHKKQVRILKGAMTIEEMGKLIGKMNAYLIPTKPKDVNIIFHFRQATTGLITPSNCHPFPVTKELDKLAGLDVLTNCALAHNGIIWESSTTYDYDEWDPEWDYTGSTPTGHKAVPLGDKTDTQEFIEDYLVDLGGNLWNPTVQKLIATFNSRFALLSARGITYIGKFLEEGGCKYSNSGYLAPTAPANKAAAGCYPFRGSYYDETEAVWKAWCFACEQFGRVLYSVPDDDSPVCADCFQTFYGRPPTADEQAFQ